MDYNHKNFRSEYYDTTLFPGPRAGEEAPDFTVYSMEGKTVRLSDFKGKWLVIETGAKTCPMYARNVPAGNALATQFPDIDFVVIYVREPHPGGNVTAHSSFEQKINNAKSLKSFLTENRRILVDNLEGAMHQKYGAMPNCIYVINPQGIVVFRSDWCVPEKLSDVLNDREKYHSQEHYMVDELGPPPPLLALKILYNAGWSALFDFFRAIPKLKKSHDVADDYYRKNGKLRR